MSNLEDFKNEIKQDIQLEKKTIEFKDQTNEELYFVSGYNVTFNSSDLNILDQDKNYIILKTNSDYLQNLKKENTKLYWVKIPENIFTDIRKQIVLV